MDGQPPLDKLRDLGYTGDPAIAIFPPFLLDDISTYLTMACHPEDGIDLLAQYTVDFPKTAMKNSHLSHRSQSATDL
jgi:hypothetical protein